MRVVIAVLLIVGLSLLLLFVVANSGEEQQVPVYLYFWPQQEYPVSLVALVSLVLGVLFASVIGIVEGTRLRLQNRQLRARLRRLEADLRGLRSDALKSAGKTPEADEQTAL